MKLLFVAADRMEFTGLLSRGEAVRPAGIAVDFSQFARLFGNDILAVANGIGRKRAVAAVGASTAFHPDAVVSIGFCGALDTALQIGDIVVGSSIIGLAGGNACPTCTHTAASGPICSIDHVARTAAEKARLRKSGAIAVEMEAAGVAARTQALNLPFYCIKSVTDLADEDMANDFDSAVRSDGHFDTIRILTGTLRHPTVRIRELIRLRNRCVRAARVLGEFIADCRF